MRRQLKASSVGSIERRASNRERFVRPALTLTLSLLLLLGLLLAPVSAFADKVVVNAIGSSQEVQPTTGGFLSLPRGIAVNTSGAGGVPAGTVYVVDAGNSRIQVFSSSGTFLRAFGADVGGAGVDICTVAASCVSGTEGAAAGQFGGIGRGIAVDQSNGNLYVTNQANKRVDVFSATGAFEGAFGRMVRVTGAAEELQFCTTATGCQAGSTENTSAAGAFSTAIGYPAVAPVGSPNEGHVYVADRGNRRVDEFEATIAGGEVTGISFVRGYGWGASSGAEEFEVCTSACHVPAAAGASLGQFATNAPFELGIDSAGNVYALDPGNNRVQEFSAAAVPLSASFAAAQIGTGPAPNDLAVDPAPGGHIYVNKSNGTEVNTLEFDSSGSLLATNGVGLGLDQSFPGGLAYDSTSGNIWMVVLGSNLIFALNSPQVPPKATLSEPINVTGPHSAVFAGTVNPEGFDATYRFEYSTDGATWTKLPVTDVDLGPGNSPIAVSKEATALLAHTEYFVRLVATKPFGAGTATTAAVSFETPAGPPTVASTSAGKITTDSAELSAQVNPEGADVSTTSPNECAFQYIDDATYLAAGESYGEGTTSIPCTPADLGAGSANVPAAATIGGLQADTVYHYRLIARNSIGPTVGSDHVLRTFAIQTDLPDNRAYEMVSPAQKIGGVFIPEPFMNLGGRFSEHCPVSGGCVPGANNTPMPMQSAANGEAAVYEGQPFSGGLSTAKAEYLSRRTPGGWETQSLSSSQFRNGSEQGYKGFSPDLSHGILYQRGASLSPEAPSKEGTSYPNLYLRQDSGLQPLLTTAPPERDPSETENGFRIFFAGANSGSAAAPAFSHVIFEANDALTGEAPDIAPAAPGIEEFETCNFTIGSGCNRNLYEWIGGQLHLVNVLPDNASAAPRPVIGSGYLLSPSGNNELETPDVDHAISADGSRIFWSDEAGQVYVRIDGNETRKIEDPGGFITASADGSKVMLSDGCLYDVEAESCEDLTQGEGGFQGILGAGEDLSRVYFVDTAVLSGGEENANEEEAEAGEPNLYAWHAGAVKFLGRLFQGDNEIGGGRQFGAWHTSALDRIAQVSGDGRFLIFQSHAPLTGYDNEVRSIGCRGDVGEAVQQNPSCFEVFEYDAGSDRLSCASCSPSGQRPLGQSNLMLVRPIGGYTVGPQPANLSPAGEGRLFFESEDELSPRDENGAIQDVYEWEPNGVGSCKRPTGCVSLISSGQSPSDSYFVNASPNGDDVFFVTREQLLPRDRDEFLDLYDARVGGGFTEAEVPPCLGEACRGSGTTAPQQQSPGSSSFAGPGNEKPKAKKHKKRRKHAHKHKSHKRAAKHNSGGSK